MSSRGVLTMPVAPIPTIEAAYRGGVPAFAASSPTSRNRALQTNPSSERSDMRPLATVTKLLAVFALAIALRTWIVAQPGIGHDGDLNLFARWTRGLTDNGIRAFFQKESFCDYPPLMLLLFRGVGTATDAIVGSEASATQLKFGVKTLACLADLAIGILLLMEGRRLLGWRPAVVAASLYLLNPVSIYDSAYWGQVDSIYTAILVAGFVFLAHGRWMLTGAACAVGLAAKFQAVAILPLLLFETYRIGGCRALGRLLAGALIAASIIAAPFALDGVLGETLERSYVRVVGQYHEMSKNAYNLWHLVGIPDNADSTPPEAIVRIVADGRDAVHVSESWLLSLTWRRISLVLFALAVAIVMSLYSLRPGPVARFGAAGLLALCFFLFPSEMHERYAFPAVAMLAIWAAARAAHERIYWLLTALLLLNLAAVLPAAPLASAIAGATLAVFALLAGGLLLSHSQAGESSMPPPRDEAPSAAGSQILIRGFQVGTVCAVVACAALAAWIHRESQSAQPPAADKVVWLSSLEPQAARQGWKALGRDQSVEGGRIQLGETIYTRGLGTHAPARLVYQIPAGVKAFESVVGLDHATRGTGSAVLRIEVDGECVFTSPRLTGQSEPLALQIPVDDARTMALIVDPTGDGKKSDHFDLALARFTAATDGNPDSQPRLP